MTKLAFMMKINKQTNK